MSYLHLQITKKSEKLLREKIVDTKAFGGIVYNFWKGFEGGTVVRRVEDTISRYYAKFYGDIKRVSAMRNAHSDFLAEQVSTTTQLLMRLLTQPSATSSDLIRDMLDRPKFRIRDLYDKVLRILTTDTSTMIALRGLLTPPAKGPASKEGPTKEQRRLTKWSPMAEDMVRESLLELVPAQSYFGDQAWIEYVNAEALLSCYDDGEAGHQLNQDKLAKVKKSIVKRRDDLATAKAKKILKDKDIGGVLAVMLGMREEVPLGDCFGMSSKTWDKELVSELAVKATSLWGTTGPSKLQKPIETIIRSGLELVQEASNIDPNVMGKFVSEAVQFIMDSTMSPSVASATESSSDIGVEKADDAPASDTDVENSDNAPASDTGVEKADDAPAASQLDRATITASAREHLQSVFGDIPAALVAAAAEGVADVLTPCHVQLCKWRSLTRDTTLSELLAKVGNRSKGAGGENEDDGLDEEEHGDKEGGGGDERDQAGGDSVSSQQGAIFGLLACLLIQLQQLASPVPAAPEGGEPEISSTVLLPRVDTVRIRDTRPDWGKRFLFEMCPNVLHAAWINFTRASHGQLFSQSTSSEWKSLSFLKKELSREFDFARFGRFMDLRKAHKERVGGKLATGLVARHEVYRKVFKNVDPLHLPMCMTWQGTDVHCETRWTMCVE
jgi:hypothetical protein